MVWGGLGCKVGRRVTDLVGGKMEIDYGACKLLVGDGGGEGTGTGGRGKKGEGKPGANRRWTCPNVGLTFTGQGFQFATAIFGRSWGGPGAAWGLP